MLNKRGPDGSSAMTPLKLGLDGLFATMLTKRAPDGSSAMTPLKLGLDGLFATMPTKRVPDGSSAMTPLKQGLGGSFDRYEGKDSFKDEKAPDRCFLIIGVRALY